MMKYEFPSNPMYFNENPLNRSAQSHDSLPVSPEAVRELLQRIVQLGREVEPYLLQPADDSIYIDYRQGSWTASMLEQFRREIYPYPAAVELLQFAAENAGQEVNYRDFLQKSSSSDTQVRAELGAISKVARKLFGKKVWPVRTRQGSDGVMRYFMPEGIAEWWTQGGSPIRSGS
jgi:hypothetical protein